MEKQTSTVTCSIKDMKKNSLNIANVIENFITFRSFYKLKCSYKQYYKLSCYFFSNSSYLSVCEDKIMFSANLFKLYLVFFFYIK